MVLWVSKPFSLGAAVTRGSCVCYEDAPQGSKGRGVLGTAGADTEALQSSHR